MPLCDLRHVVQHDHSYSAVNPMPKEESPEVPVVPVSEPVCVEFEESDSEESDDSDSDIIASMSKISFPRIVIVMTLSQKRKIQTSCNKKIKIGLKKTAGKSMKKRNLLYLRVN